jgi:hypothetical protein
METPPDDPLVFHGVWLGPDPKPTTPANAATGAKRRWRWLVTGLLLVAGGGAVGLLAGLILAHPVLGAAGGAAVGLCGAGYVTVIRRRDEDRKQPIRAAPTAPLEVVYTPMSLAEPDDPRLRELEEVLLGLCREDRALFDRLINHERTRYPHCSRAELVRLAIDHFRRDRHYLGPDD